MLDPMQAYYASANPAPQDYLDEEQFAQRYGRVVVAGQPLSSRLLCRVGKLLIRIGEKLAAENTNIELNKGAA